MKRNAYLIEEKAYRSEQISLILGFIFGIFSLILYFLVFSKISIYSDDYIFATFFSDGFLAYIRNVIFQYMHMNGRVFVHVLAHITLYFDTTLYLLFCPVFLVGLFYCSYQCFSTDSEKNKLVQIVIAIVLGLFLVLGMDIAYLRVSLFWISGFYNYIFPIFMVVLSVYFQKKMLENNKISWFGLFFCFLAGATTEQSAIIVLVCLFGVGALSLFILKKNWKIFVFPFVSAFLGFLTIMISPGTGNRIQTEAGGSILTTVFSGQFLEQCRDVSSFITGINSYFLLFLLFAIATGIVGLRDKNAPKVLILGFPAAFILAAAQYLKIHYVYVAIFLLCYITFVAFAMLTKKNYWSMGFLLIGAELTQFAIAITSVFGYRTTVPALLIIIIVTANLLSRSIKKSHWIVPAFLLSGIFVFVLVSFVPMYQGYALANITNDANIEKVKNAKNTETIQYSLDFDQFYGYTPMHIDDYFCYYYLKHFGGDAALNRYDNLYFNSDVLPSVIIDGKKGKRPVVEMNGTVYFPILNIFENLGANIQRSNDRIIISYRENTYILQQTSNENFTPYNIYINDEKPFSGDVIYYYCSTYAAETLFDAFAGFTIHHDSDENCYIIKSEN